MTGGFTIHALTAALAALLVAAVVTDLRARVIENWTVATIALLAPLWWWAQGMAPWPDVAWQLLLALVVLAIFVAVWRTGKMGGGDVKLIAALALWLPLAPFFLMLWIMAVAGGVLTIAVLVARRLRAPTGPAQVPYGVAIAVGGLWVMSEPYLNHFA